MANQEVTEVQQLLMDKPDDLELMLKETDCFSNFASASVAYEKFLHQKSKITWLKLGDEGTGYFHASMRSRSTQRQSV